MEEYISCFAYLNNIKSLKALTFRSSYIKILCLGGCIYYSAINTNSIQKNQTNFTVRRREKFITKFALVYFKMK